MTGQRRMMGSETIRAALVAALISILLPACAGRAYRPVSLDSTALLSRVQTQSEGGVRVRAAVPSPEEAEAIFGIPTYARGIQPVWLEVENLSENRVRFAPVGVDRDYFSPLEVAYMNRKGFSGKARSEMEQRFYDLAMDRQIHPGETASGFVFTHARPGTKSFNVDLFGAAGEDHSFTFFIEVPGFVPDHAEVAFEGLYAPEEVRDYDAQEFRDVLASMPCCTSDQSGDRSGLPVNIVIIGEGRDVLQALLRAGWHETRRPQETSALARAHHLRGRVPDAVFRFQRTGAGERNELRVWLAPMRFDDRPVWFGQITHYIGSATRLERALFDPSLDPDIDDARDYLLQTMWYAQGLEKYAWISTGHPVPITAPRRDFSGARYFTDGYRSVLWLSGAPVSLMETIDMEWDTAPRR